jgi:hypothetical protein
MSMKYRDYAPALFHGAKIYPEDLAGLVGQPVVGNVYYVDANNGSDSDEGTSFGSAFKTLGKAEDVCTSFNYDVIIVAPSANSVTTEASITWDKSFITVIGATAPVAQGQRSRIGFGSSATSPCLTISGMGNRFINLKLVVEEDINVMVYLTGDRNYFNNVEFAGICNSTTGDDTSARVISMSGAGENLFENCSIGVDTVARSVANYTLEMASSCERNTFRNCQFELWADSADACFGKISAAGAIDRFVLFDHCLFNSNGTNAGGTALTKAFDTGNAIGGSIFLWDSWLYGATDWADDFTMLEGLAGSQATGASCGLALTVA